MGMISSWSSLIDGKMDLALSAIGSSCVDSFDRILRVTESCGECPSTRL